MIWRYLQKDIANEFKNVEELSGGGELKVGDLIEFRRDYYNHWAVYIGRVFYGTETGAADYLPMVVHYSDGTYDFNVNTTVLAGKSGSVVVRLQSLYEVAGPSRCRINNASDTPTNAPLPEEEIKERALSELGKSDYGILWKNCEHFANWCRYGVSQSQQIRDITEESLLVVVAFFAALGLIVVRLTR